LVSVLDGNPDVFAVSGRGIHPLSTVRRPTSPMLANLSRLSNAVASKARALEMRLRPRVRPNGMLFRLTGQAGRLGASIANPVALRPDPLAYIGGSVIRGPLALKRADYLEIGGFDLDHFFLGNDDHDLIMRAQLELGRTGAYVPVQFSSPLDAGSTRKPRPPGAQQWFADVQQTFTRESSLSVLFGPQEGASVKKRPFARSIRPVPRRESQDFGKESHG